MTRTFPREEMFGLTSQVRRAAVSIPSNIAEGHSRASRAEFLRFLSIAAASLSELETQMELAERLQYLTRDAHANFVRQASSLGRQLNGLRRSLLIRTGPRPPTPDPH
jgi:four helix bundle protein